MNETHDLKDGRRAVARVGRGVDQKNILARLQGRVDLLAELERAHEGLQIFAGQPSPEFQGNFRRRARF